MDDKERKRSKNIAHCVHIREIITAQPTGKKCSH